MQITTDEFNNFLTVLRRTDFYYPYADGAAYHDGFESFCKARKMFTDLIDKYPDSRAQIMQAWQEHGGKV